MTANQIAYHANKLTEEANRIQENYNRGKLQNEQFYNEETQRHNTRMEDLQSDANYIQSTYNEESNAIKDRHATISEDIQRYSLELQYANESRKREIETALAKLESEKVKLSERQQNLDAWFKGAQQAIDSWRIGNEFYIGLIGHEVAEEANRLTGERNQLEATRLAQEARNEARKRANERWSTFVSAQTQRFVTRVNAETERRANRWKQQQGWASFLEEQRHNQAVETRNAWETGANYLSALGNLMRGGGSLLGSFAPIGKALSTVSAESLWKKYTSNPEVQQGLEQLFGGSK